MLSNQDQERISTFALRTLIILKQCILIFILKVNTHPNRIYCQVTSSKDSIKGIKDRWVQDYKGFIPTLNNVIKINHDLRVLKLLQSNQRSLNKEFIHHLLPTKMVNYIGREHFLNRGNGYKIWPLNFQGKFPLKSINKTIIRYHSSIV